jgi:hypothetical protein
MVPGFSFKARSNFSAGLSNERDFPHLVELALPSTGLRAIFLDFDAFHRQNRIPARRGRSQHDIGQPRIRLFPNAAIADAFRARFGGVRMTYAPEDSKSRISFDNPCGCRLGIACRTNYPVVVRFY